MDLSDLRKIRRQLRQLRAKLYALSEAARETSYIRAPDINLVSSTTNVETLSSASSSSGTTFLDLRHPSAARVTVKYGKKGRRGGGMQSQARTNGTNGHGTTHNVSNLGLHRSDLNRLASPVRRQALGLHDCFKDVAEKVWNIGSSSKPSSRTSSPQKNLIKNTLSEVDTIYTVPSLAQLASFAVAKNIPVSEGEYDDEGLALEEEWYEVVPGHYRRYVLCDHVIQLCKTCVSVPAIYVPMIDVCIGHRAFMQAWDLLNHFWSLRSTHVVSEWLYALEASKTLHRQKDWIHAVGAALTPRQCVQSDFKQVLGWLCEEDCEVLRMYAVRSVVFGSSGASRGSSMFEFDEEEEGIDEEEIESDVDMIVNGDAELTTWVRDLLIHSCRNCNNHGCICSETVLQACRKMDMLKGGLGDEERMTLLLRGSQLWAAMEGDVHQDEDEEEQLSRHLRGLNDPTISFDPITTYYPTFEHLETLRQHLHCVDQTPLAVRITLAMLNDYETLRERAREHGGWIPDKEELRIDLETKHAGGEKTPGRVGPKWRYEPLLHTWIAATPAAPVMKREGEEEEEEEDDIAGYTPLPKRLRGRGKVMNASGKEIVKSLRLRGLQKRPPLSINNLNRVKLTVVEDGVGIPRGLKRVRIEEVGDEGKKKKRTYSGWNPNKSRKDENDMESDDGESDIDDEDEQDEMRKRRKIVGGQLDIRVAEPLPLTEEVDELAF